MDERLKISYETMGFSSYMTVTCPADMELIHYQLEMMLSNEIKKLLPVTRQMIDGETVIYYNITSRIPLDQILEKRKLTRKELLRLIEGSILAIRDASEFRLPSQGILMETERVYVNPGTCDPAFVFLPIKDAGGNGIKELVTGLVINDRIEMSDDNLIQVLLKELNSQPFSIERLEQCLESYYGMKRNVKNQALASSQMVDSHAAVSPFISSQPITLSSASPFMAQQPGGSQPVTPPVVQQRGSQSITPPMAQQGNSQFITPPTAQQWGSSQSITPFMAQQGSSQPITPLMAQQQGSSRPVVSPPVDLPSVNGAAKRPELPKDGNNKKKKKQEKKGKKTDAVSQEIGEDGFDRKAAKQKFMLPQALIMVMVAAGISFGLFADENGTLAVNTILAFVIGIAVVEIVLYREIYINSRKGNRDKKSSKKNKKKESNVKSRPLKDRPAPPRPPKPVDLQQSSHPMPATPVLASAVQSIQSQPQQVQSSQLMQLESVQSMQLKQPAQFHTAQSVQPIQFVQTEQPQSVQPIQMPQPVAFMNDSALEGEDASTGDETELWGGVSQGGAPAYLEYYENGKISRIPINPLGGTVIGRLKGQVDFAVKSPRVGKMHARVFCENGQYFVVDINSKNGTYINGNRARIESNIPYPLHDKDRIMLADSEFTIRCGEG